MSQSNSYPAGSVFYYNFESCAQSGGAGNPPPPPVQVDENYLWIMSPSGSGKGFAAYAGNWQISGLTLDQGISQYVTQAAGNTMGYVVGTKLTPNKSWYYPTLISNTCTGPSSSCSFTYQIPAGGSANVTVSDGHASIPTQMTCTQTP